MIYILSFIFILSLFLFFYVLYGIKNMNDLNNIEEISPKDIEQTILIKIARYEKYLYKKNFVRREILKVSAKKSNVKNYKFYYYNMIEGIHAFLEVYKIQDNFAVNYFFATIYQSGKYTISTKFTKESSKTKKNAIFIYKYKDLNIQELFIMHKIDRKIENENILKEKLSLNKLLELPLFIKTLPITKKNEKFINMNFKIFKFLSIPKLLHNTKIAN